MPQGNHDDYQSSAYEGINLEPHSEITLHVEGWLIQLWVNENPGSKGSAVYRFMTSFKDLSNLEDFCTFTSLKDSLLLNILLISQLSQHHKTEKQCRQFTEPRDLNKI